MENLNIFIFFFIFYKINFLPLSFTKGFLTDNFSIKRRKKGIISFNLCDLFYSDIFYNKIIDFITTGNVYYVVARINYGKRQVVFTKTQVALDFRDGDISNIYSTHDVICDQLKYTFEDYNITEDQVNNIDVICNYLDIKFLSDLSYYTNNYELSKQVKTFLDKQVEYFPIEISDNTLGKPLNDVTIKDGKVDSVKVKHKGQ